MITAIVDTCIIIDALQKREPFWKDAEKIFIAVANENFLGTITAKAVTDIYYLHHRNTHDGETTRKILQQLLEILLFVLLSSLYIRQMLRVILHHSYHIHIPMLFHVLFFQDP